MLQVAEKIIKVIKVLPKDLISERALSGECRATLEKITCGSGTCAWVWCSDTSRRLQRNGSCLITVHPNLMPATTKVATPKKKSLVVDSRCTTSSQSLGRHAQILHCAKRMVDLVVVELAHWDGVLCYLCQTLPIIAL